MKKRGLIILSLLITILFTTSVFAQDVDSASNLLAFNENVSITKEILGDVYSGGRSVIIKEKVTGDIISGAETIDIRSKEVKGNIRTASRTLKINSKNVNNITSAAQTINIGKDTTAKGLYLSGEEINFKGSCNGFYATGGTIIINGKINGDLDVSCEELIIAEKGDITGNINIKSTKEPVLNSTVSVNDIQFTKIDTEKTANKVNNVLRIGTLISLLSSFVIGLVLYILFKRFFISSEEVLIKEPLSVVLGGISSFILLPIASLLLFITVVGLPLGIISLFMYFVVVYLSPVITGIIVGRVIFREQNPYLQLLGGIFIIRMLSLLPYIGGFVWVTSGMLSFGLIIYELSKSVNHKEIRKKDID